MAEKKKTSNKAAKKPAASKAKAPEAKKAEESNNKPSKERSTKKDIQLPESGVVRLKANEKGLKKGLIKDKIYTKSVDVAKALLDKDLVQLVD